jgi:hypothetical protein
MNEKFKELIAALSAEERSSLMLELRPQAAERVGVDIREITPERLQDSSFAARVREEIAAAMRGEI